MADAEPSDLTALTSPRTRYLLDQVRWFTRLRWWAVAGMVSFTALGAHAFGILPRPAPLYLVAGFTALLNVYYLSCFRDRSQIRFASVRRHVDLQIGLDLLVLTALLHFSGGVANPFVSFFLFHRNGYEALRLLDDNQDGELSGFELDGLAIWTDENSDGVSQRHEVQQVWETDILAIGTQHTTNQEGVMHNPRGVRYSDGRYVPTFDWVVSRIVELSGRTVGR